MPLAEAVSIFRDMERARRALRFLASEQAVDFTKFTDQGSRPLHDWEIRQLLDTLSPDETDDAGVQLSLTDAGDQKFAHDSKSFFDSLFSR